MNEETKKFKKVMKTRNRRAGKVRMLGKERQVRRSLLRDARESYIEAKKEISNKIIEMRHKRMEQLKKILEIPESELISLEALEKKYEVAYKAAKRETNK